jgi:hypothetical protein
VLSGDFEPLDKNGGFILSGPFALTDLDRIKIIL